MENTKLPAFPLHPELEMPNQQWSGLSKHEYAAIMIAQGVAAATPWASLHSEDMRQRIASVSYLLAAEVLNQFK